jgi:hypothetical protein
MTQDRVYLGEDFDGEDEDWGESPHG